ncbi:MAG: DUF445 family protein [Gemmatimonadetes bacterium]|nr:DUF445 family protein [Gemmatimonadota bacterium]
MDLSTPLGSFVVNVVVGTVAGGVTNAVAVWMLFHPYQRRFGLQGAIPKNHDRLAKSIGRVVGDRLLTAEDLGEALQRDGLRETLDAKLNEFVQRLLDREWPSLRALLPAEVLPDVERALDVLEPQLAAALANHAETPAFEAQVLAFVQRARAELAPLSMGLVLTPERRAQLAAQTALLATELLEEGRTQEGRPVGARVRDLLFRVAGTERTQQFVERAVNDALTRAEGRSWGELLAPLEDEVVARWILDAARSARAKDLGTEAAASAARVLLDRPIGRLSRFLPADASISLAHRAAPALWAWLSLQLPGIIASLDVHGIVERKVLGFSTQRMEELVRNVTQKELNLIVNLGYVLGAVIGVVTWVVGRMVG